MKILNENEILKIFPLESKFNSDIHDLQKALFEQYKASLSININLESYETKLTGKKMVEWINPMLFQQNLNSAIDALESYEILDTKELNLTSYRLRKNFMRGLLEDKIQYSNNHDTLSSSDNLNDVLFSVNYRKIKKFLDLLEYSKAAKYGAKILFGIDDIYNSSLLGVNKVREDLRTLLIASKKLIIKTQEITLPISARYSKLNSNTFVVDSFKTINNKRVDLLDSLDSSELIFKLSDHPFFKKYKYNMLLRVGIEVIDNYTVSKPADRLNKAETYWAFELKDESGGFSFGSANIDNHSINNCFFYNVPAGKEGEIVWSSNETLINVNGNRDWKLSILDNNIPGHNKINDITLHFHISFIQN